MNDRFVPRGNKFPQEDFIVKSIDNSIPYVVRNSTGDWSEDFAPYQPQKFKFDTNSCWCISGINIIEDELDFLLRNGNFPESSVQWFRNNGYILSTDCFRLAWRYPYALSGVYGNGNSQWNLVTLIQRYGILPLSDFDFTYEDSLVYSDQESQNKACGDSSKITDSMRSKALEFLKYVNIQEKWVGKYPITPPLQDIRASLLQSPLQIGVPACLDTWNTGKVLSCGRTIPDHAVELYKVLDDGTYCIFDQYEPHLKTLAPDYPLLMVTNIVVVPNITVSDIPNVPKYPDNMFTRIWQAVQNWFARQGL